MICRSRLSDSSLLGLFFGYAYTCGDIRFKLQIGGAILLFVPPDNLLIVSRHLLADGQYVLIQSFFTI